MKSIFVCGLLCLAASGSAIAAHQINNLTLMKGSRARNPARPFVENGHEIISTYILSLLLIQVGQLSATVLSKVCALSKV